MRGISSAKGAYHVWLHLPEQSCLQLWWEAGVCIWKLFGAAGSFTVLLGHWWQQRVGCGRSLFSVFTQFDEKLFNTKLAILIPRKQRRISLCNAQQLLCCICWTPAYRTRLCPFTPCRRRQREKWFLIKAALFLQSINQFRLFRPPWSCLRFSAVWHFWFSFFNSSV